MLRTLGALVLGAAVLAACGSPWPPALLASTTHPTVRVLLGERRPEEELLLPEAPWRFVAQDASFSWSGSEARRVALAATREGIRLGQQQTSARRVRLETRAPFSIAGRRYPGELLILQEGDFVLLINLVDLETYLAVVIGHELGPHVLPATHRAQAIAARTWAWSRLLRPNASAETFDVYDDSRSQVYAGIDFPPEYGVTWEEMLLAAQANAGVILTFRGRPIPAYYSSTCGGHTTDPETSHLEAEAGLFPLRGVPCQHCRPSDSYASKYWRWERMASEESLADALKAVGRPISLPVHEIRLADRGRGDWVRSATIVYGPSQRVKEVPGTVLRTAARLPSHRIESVTRTQGGQWTFRGGGWGHGVGLCQVGAIQMGHRGATETEILRYYYPGISFTKVY